MNRSMPEVSSDSSSSCYSSDSSSVLDEHESRPVNIFDFITWNSTEGNLSNFSETFKQFSADEKLFLLKSRCLSVNCTCNFKNYDLLLARVYVGLKILVGKWCKLRFSKGAVPDTDKIATFIFFKDFQGWYEIMNENLEVIPFWNNVSQIVQNKPKLFLLRRDYKSLYVKDSAEDPNGPVTFDSTLIKAGTILSFTQCRKYSMKKGRRIKEQYLCKCKDMKGNCFYFIPEDTVYSSPIAGQDNISGAHTFQTIIEKFHFPLNVRPIFMTPPVPNLPYSDRHFLQLSERFQFDLIFVTPVKDSNRLFLLTPNLFDDHVFTIGEFLPSSVTKQALPGNMTQHISNHQTKIDTFFAKCHKYDSLSYLLKNVEDISKLSQKFEASDKEFDDDYIEVEGIYFYIRNGYFPRNFITEKPKNEISPVPEPVSSNRESVSSISTSDESTEISTTSSDSVRTSSTAMEMYNKRRLKQAKSMPLGKSKNKIENSEYNTSNSRCNINLTVDDMMNLTMTGVCVPEEDELITKRVTEVPKFYQNLVTFRESDIEATSLRDTMV